ncbi:MAG: DUF3467 domain-containing protein [Nitrospirae bacterium]|nr:DUF3467 domain-containing protein [Nitrospirota bacterium]
MPDEQKKEVRINFPQDLQGGVYANNMVVSHTREEFIMDFLMVGPRAGAVTARVITSPGHIKRIIAALQDNIKRYEQRFGNVKVAEEPKGSIGFTPSTKH